MRKKKFIISGILFCMAICFSVPSLWANILGTPTNTMALTHEQILSEFNPMVEHLLFSEIPMTMADFHFGGADITKPPEGTDAGKKGPADISDLPDTSKKPETVSNFESVLDHLQPYVLGAGPVAKNLEELRKARKEAIDKLVMKGLKNRDAKDRARSAADRLQRAMNEVMDAKPGSEEAREAAKEAKQAAKEAQETAEQAKNTQKEYDEAREEAEKAHKEYTEKAHEAAEKQNEAAREAAEKAYEATGHGKSNKK